MINSFPTISYTSKALCMQPNYYLIQNQRREWLVCQRFPNIFEHLLFDVKTGAYITGGDYSVLLTLV